MFKRKMRRTQICMTRVLLFNAPLSGLELDRLLELCGQDPTAEESEQADGNISGGTDYDGNELILTSVSANISELLERFNRLRSFQTASITDLYDEVVGGMNPLLKSNKCANQLTER